MAYPTLRNQGDHLGQVVEAHERLLCNEYRNHYDKFKNLRQSDPEAAKSEAAIFALLTKLRLNPEPYDAPGTGGPDFICRPDNRAPFAVEVTALGEQAFARQSNLPANFRDQWQGQFHSEGVIHAIRTRISDKAEQMANRDFAGVLAVTTTHPMGEWVLNQQGAEWLLTSKPGIRWGSSTLVTDLRDSIFFRVENGEIVACRKYISAILLVLISDSECHVLGILHPEPAHCFDISNFAEVPFVRISEWPLKEGAIRWEWVVDAPRAKGFRHKAVDHTQAATSDQVIQLFESQFDNIVRSWHDLTLTELASEQRVQPIHQLEEVLGKGEGLWKDEEEFQGFVQGIYQRRQEDRERGA